MAQHMWADETTPIPRKVFLELACDGEHGLFGAPVARFEITGGDPRHPAVAAGWTITANGPVYCPECRRRKEPG